MLAVRTTVLANLRSAAEAGLASGAQGFLITDWGDQGHWQYLPASYVGLLAGASLSWCLSENTDVVLADALDALVYRDRSGVMGRCSIDAGNLYKLVAPLKFNQSQLWRFLRYTRQEVVADGVDVHELVHVEERIRELYLQLDEVRMNRPDDRLVQREWVATLQWMLHGCQRVRGKISQAEEQQQRHRLLAQHRELWSARNRPGGYEESVQHLAACTPN